MANLIDIQMSSSLTIYDYTQITYFLKGKDDFLEKRGKLYFFLHISSLPYMLFPAFCLRSAQEKLPERKKAEK